MQQWNWRWTLRGYELTDPNGEVKFCLGSMEDMAKLSCLLLDKYKLFEEKFEIMEDLNRSLMSQAETLKNVIALNQKYIHALEGAFEQAKAIAERSGQCQRT